MGASSSLLSSGIILLTVFCPSWSFPQHIKPRGPKQTTINSKSSTTALSLLDDLVHSIPFILADSDRSKDNEQHQIEGHDNQPEARPLFGNLLVWRRPATTNGEHGGAEGAHPTASPAVTPAAPNGRRISSTGSDPGSGRRLRCWPGSKAGKKDGGYPSRCPVSAAAARQPPAAGATAATTTTAQQQQQPQQQQQQHQQQHQGAPGRVAPRRRQAHHKPPPPPPTTSQPLSHPTTSPRHPTHSSGRQHLCTCRQHPFNGRRCRPGGPPGQKRRRPPPPPREGMGRRRRCRRRRQGCRGGGRRRRRGERRRTRRRRRTRSSRNSNNTSSSRGGSRRTDHRGGCFWRVFLGFEIGFLSGGMRWPLEMGWNRFFFLR